MIIPVDSREYPKNILLNEFMHFSIKKTSNQTKLKCFWFNWFDDFRFEHRSTT